MIKYLTKAFFVVLFAWISFFPQPIQGEYEVYVRIGLAVFLLILVLDKRGIKDIVSVKDWPLWLFIICLLAGIVSATDKSVAFRTYIYLAITFLFLFYIGKGIFSCDRDRKLISVTICICSSLVALGGILECFFAFNPIYEYFIENLFYIRYITGFVRPMSTQLNPAPLATYLLFALPFAIHIFKKKGSLKRFLGFVAIVLNITCLLLTFCRSSFLGLLAMLFFYQLVSKRYKALFIALLLISIFSMGAYFLPYPFNRISPRGIFIDGTGILSQYRLDRMAITWEMFKDKPFLGVGLNNFRILFDKFYLSKPIIQFIPYEIKIADNMYLTLIAETGIIGFTGFIIFIFSLFRKGMRNFHSLNNESK